MLLGRDTVVGPAIASQHIGMMHRMWQDRGEPMPWAMVLGGPPAALLAAGMPLPEQVNEDGYVGALTGAPIEVVKAETSDLLVPATSEIVLEGYVSPGETAPEGPMGEYHGYVFPEVKQKPVFRVRAVTFRDDPILPVCTAGLPPEENHTIWGPLVSAAALDTLRRAGLPVEFAWMSFEAAGCWLVLSVDLDALAARRTTDAQFAEDVANTLYPTHAGGLVPKVILVGNDIDITDIGQVVWAVATRHHPGTGHHVFPDLPTFPLVPYLTATESAAARGGNVVISCLFPEQYEGRTAAKTASFATSYPKEMRDRVLANWTRYGYTA
jgi:4-hydroxy-3-polyprenylbenzoate decarboxylase